LSYGAIGNAPINGMPRGLPTYDASGSIILSQDSVLDVGGGGRVLPGGYQAMQTISGAPLGNAHLIAPRGTVDAGAAGIRFSGNLNIASLYVTNAFNIQVQGVTTGVLNVAAPNTIALTAASNTAGAATDLATQAIKQQTGLAEQPDVPSLITVEVLGYGGPNDD
jgi:hypothetical protein